MIRVELLYGPLDGQEVEVSEDANEWRPSKELLVKLGFPRSKPVYILHHPGISFIYAYDDRQPPSANLALIGDD